MRCTACNRCDYGVVDCRFAEFLLQKILRLFKEVAGGVKEIFLQGIIHIFINIQLVDIMRNTTGNTVNKGLFFRCQCRVEGSNFFICQCLNLVLTGTTAIERAFVAEHLIFHKAHGGAAEDQIQLPVFPCMVNDMLQAGGNRFVCLCEIRILVDDKHKTLLFCHTGNLIKGCFKALEHRSGFHAGMILFINRL